MTDQPEPEIIPADEAKDILYTAITAELGHGWDDADSRWTIVTNTAYMARLNKGRVNVDFHVNYFDGEVTVETSEIDHGQETGRIFAWMMFGLFIVLVLATVRALGLL